MEILSKPLSSIGGIADKSSPEVDCQFFDYGILNWHLATLSPTLREAGIRIKHLSLPTLLGQAITREPPVKHLFSALTSLSFNLHDPAYMLGDYDEPPPSFRTLMQCARHTLEKLQFSNLLNPPSEHPRRGELLLEKLWGHEPGSETETLVFPRLKELSLSSLVLYAPSLIKFLEAQPALEKVTFRHVYLPTQGYGWPDVAAALPASCHSLHMSHCGGQSAPRAQIDPLPDSMIRWERIEPFRPYQDHFPKSCGWHVSKSHVEGETEEYIIEHHVTEKKRIAEQIAAAQDDGEQYVGAPLGELLKQEMELDRRIASKTHEARVLKERIRNQDYADYERLP